MQHLFLIAAGGTGAKVAESLIHLCAAGLGPAQLDVLLLDVDKDNGNVERTRDAAELYSKLRVWDWTLSPRSTAKGGAVPLAGTRFFQTALTLHPCLDEISAVNEGGLRVHLHDEPGAQPLLDLLYDEQEQDSQCEKGFLARPNLGSLVLGGHLREKFAAESGGAAAFKARLFDALSGASAEKPVPLMVVGSIFGGTGASLFPVVCECVREAVSLGQKDSGNWEKVAPCAVMLTPYFLPNQTGAETEEDTVDPSRFQVDTANALRHYVDTTVLNGFEMAYLVGSDQPQLTRLKFVDGARDQANPALLEEVVAALAAFDAGSAGHDPSRARRVYQPPSGEVGWTSLPFPAQGAARLALLLELAAFVLLPAGKDQELSGGLLYACRHWHDQFELLPWYETLLGGWARANFSHAFDRSKPGGGWGRLADANVLPGHAAGSLARDLLAEYSYRLLLWARTALPDTATCHLVRMGKEMDYALVWEVMCGLSADEIEPPDRAAGGAGDNAFVRLARAAAVAMARIAAGQYPRGGNVVNRTPALPGFPGQGEGEPQPCLLPIDQAQLPELAARYNLTADAHAKYVKTELARP